MSLDAVSQNDGTRDRASVAKPLYGIVCKSGRITHWMRVPMAAMIRWSVDPADVTREWPGDRRIGKAQIGDRSVQARLDRSDRASLRRYDCGHLFWQALAIAARVGWDRRRPGACSRRSRGADTRSRPTRPGSLSTPSKTCCRAASPTPTRRADHAGITACRSRRWASACWPAPRSRSVHATNAAGASHRGGRSGRALRQRHPGHLAGDVLTISLHQVVPDPPCWPGSRHRAARRRRARPARP